VARTTFAAPAGRDVYSLIFKGIKLPGGHLAQRTPFVPDRNAGVWKKSVNRLISLIRPENLPSRRVAEKMGMSLRKQVMWRNLPHHVFVVLRPKMY
jgi:hypothetical protein